MYKTMVRPGAIVRDTADTWPSPEGSAPGDGGSILTLVRPKRSRALHRYSVASARLFPNYDGTAWDRRGAFATVGTRKNVAFAVVEFRE